MKRTVIKGCVGGRGEGWVTHHKKRNGRMQNAQTGCSPGVSAELGHKYWGGTKETDFFISFDLMVGEGWAYFSPLFLYGHSSGDTTSLPEKEATPYFTASRAVRLLERLEVQEGLWVHHITSQGESISEFCLDHPRFCR